MTMLKYSLNRRIGLLSPSYFDGIIEFRAGSMVIKQGAFLTTNKFNEPLDVQNHLALTYSPKYRYDCTYEGEEVSINSLNRCIELITTYNDNNRVWPSFGKPGGAKEFILTRGNLDYTNEFEFRMGGKTNAFIQDSTQSDLVFSNWFAQKFYEWFLEQKMQGTEKETIRGKIMDGLGVIINWLGGKTYKYYTISCAYKEIFSQKPLTLVKFWGCVWEDKEAERLLSIPITDCYCFDTSRKGIIANGSAIIKGILSNIHRSMKSVANNFENFPLDVVSLP